MTTGHPSDLLCSPHPPGGMLHMALPKLHLLPPTLKIPVSPCMVFQDQAAPLNQRFQVPLIKSFAQCALVCDTAVSLLAQAQGSLGTPVVLRIINSVLAMNAPEVSEVPVQQRAIQTKLVPGTDILVLIKEAAPAHSFCTHVSTPHQLIQTPPPPSLFSFYTSRGRGP